MTKNNNKPSGLRGTIFFQSLFRSELFINTSVLITGSVIAQVIPVLLQPILRRSIPAEFFGAYSVYLSLIGILIVISSFKYELAIILPRSDKEAANVLLLAFLLNAVTNTFLFIIIFFFKISIARFLNLSQNYSHYLYFVPLATFLFGSYQVVNYWLLRKKCFYQSSVNKLVRRSAEGVSQIALKSLKVPGFLILGDIVGHFANIIYGFIQAGRNGMKMEYFSAVKLKYVAGKYIDYPKFNLIPSLIGACSSLLPIIMINKFYSLENAGFLDLSRMLLSIPVALISISVSSVLLERISNKFKERVSLVKELSRIGLILIFLGLFEILIIKIFGEDLFRIFFGSQWGYSGVLAKILVWSYTLNFIISSFNSLFLSLNRIKLLSLWQLIYFIAILSLILFRNFPFENFVKIYVLVELCSFILLAFFLFTIVSDYERKICQH